MNQVVFKISKAFGIAAILMVLACSKVDSEQPQQNNDSNGFEKVDLSQLSTKWDDGWECSIKEHWTEAVNDNLKIYIYHPNQQADAYHSNLVEGNDNAANILVVPYFSNMTSIQDRGIQSFESITFLTADAIDKVTGKPVHLVFFKKHYSTGNGRYMLVVAESQSAFEMAFGNNYIDPSSWDYMDQINSWNKLANMQWRNRFALSSNLLKGTWSSGNTSTLSYYYANGGYAGATGVSVADEFRFLSNNNYESSHSGASGMVGNMQFSHVEYKGFYTIHDTWTIEFTNRFQGDSEVYDCYFEAIKQGLLLVLRDRNNTTTWLAKH